MATLCFTNCQAIANQQRGRGLKVTSRFFHRFIDSSFIRSSQRVHPHTSLDHSLDTMRTTQIAQYALRLTYAQPVNREKMMSRSAVLLAAIGLGLSTFSVRQMILHQTRRF